MKIFSRHDAITNGIHTSLLLYFSAPSERQLASNRTPFSGEKEMMTIPLKRREYLRATHLPRQNCSLAMAVGSKLKVHLHRKSGMQHVTNQNRAQRPFCFLTNQTKVQILDYGQTTGKVNVSGVLFPPPQ